MTIRIGDEFSYVNVTWCVERISGDRIHIRPIKGKLRASFAKHLKADGTDDAARGFVEKQLAIAASESATAVAAVTRKRSGARR